MRALIAAVVGFASLAALAQGLPDGGRIAVENNAVARHAQDGSIVWRVAFPDDPQVHVDGDAIRVESASAVLADSVVADAEGSAGFKPMLRISWKTVRADRTVTTSKVGPWSYANIGTNVLIRLQHEVFGKIEPRTVQKGDAVYVSAGSAGVLDDGAFTIAELIPDWRVTHYKDVVAQRAENDQGQKAKELVVDRWLQTDAPMTLGGLRGRVVLLDFWGNWCAPCVAAIPQVVKLARAKPDLTVIGVHSKMAAERLEKFLAKRKYEVPIAVDTGATEKAYGVRGWPTYVLVDRRGNIRYRDVRLPPTKLVDQLLAEP